MCTIGAVKNQSTGNSIYFKNVDQTYICHYPDAFIAQGKEYRYLKIPSNADPGSEWRVSRSQRSGGCGVGSRWECASLIMSAAASEALMIH